MIYALIGFLAMVGMLVGIGTNKPRGMSVKMWCYGYLIVSVVFDALVVLALLNQTAPQYAPLTEVLLGLSAGAATNMAVHVAHHISEEDQHEETGTKKEKTPMFGF